MRQFSTAFLDLNGTLVEPVQVETLGELHLIDGASTALLELHQAGLSLPVVTVQSRIAKGYFSKAEFAEWFQQFQRQVEPAILLGPYVCPHRFSEPCACKKESGYLYRQAAFEHGLDLSEAIVIGDTEGDLEAARNLGVPGCLVKTGWGVQADQSGAAVVGDNILTIARKVIGGELSWNQ